MVKLRVTTIGVSASSIIYKNDFELHLTNNIHFPLLRFENKCCNFDYPL